VIRDTIAGFVSGVDSVEFRVLHLAVDGQSLAALAHRQPRAAPGHHASLEHARPAPGPDNLRRPYWLPRSYKPALEAYYLSKKDQG